MASDDTAAQREADAFAADVVAELSTPARKATVYVVLDARERVVSVAANKRVAEEIGARHASHGFDGYRIEPWAVRYGE